MKYPKRPITENNVKMYLSQMLKDTDKSKEMIIRKIVFSREILTDKELTELVHKERPETKIDGLYS